MTLPRLVITGSSGFIGRHLLDALKGRYEIVGLARRSQSRCGAPEHASIHWRQVDIADGPRLRDIFDEIALGGAVDTVIHLAAHYDFEDGNDAEYYRTNVDGLRNVLDCCRQIGVKNFVFSSSLAACAFPRTGHALNEESAPDGDHVYARTKAIGERMLVEYSDSFRPVIVRFAALFSDWCEYPPLFMFIGTWLSRAWNRRILGGKGRSAIPYLHVRDAVQFLEATLERMEDLESGEILIASPDEVVTHTELYYSVTQYNQADVQMPVYVPRALAGPGIRARCLLGRLTGTMPFERPWMATYIDRQMIVDASRSRARLAWQPRKRLGLLRRMSFMIGNLRANQSEWNERNRAAMKRVRQRPNLQIADLLARHREEISTRFTVALQERVQSGHLPSYGEIGHEEHRWNHRLILRSLINSVRTRDRIIFLSYCEDLAERRCEQGFAAEELCGALESLEQVCLAILNEEAEADELRPWLFDHLSVTVRFAIDHVLEVYDLMEEQRRRQDRSARATTVR